MAECEKEVSNPLLVRLNVSDLIRGTDAAHAFAGQRLNPSPQKRKTGPQVWESWGRVGVHRSFRWAQFGLVAARQKSRIFVSRSKVQYLEGIVLFC